MKSAIVIMFGLAALAAVWIYLRAGWPIAVIGVLSILSGLLYTAGPWPLGYLGLGEIFVFIFFGPVAVAGTYYALTLEMNMGVLLAGIGPGLLSAAILAVNNLRDITTDRQANKKTLAVRFGKNFAQAEYFILVLAASLVPLLVFYIIRDHIATFVSVSIAFLALPCIRTVFSRADDGPALNRTLAQTGFLLLLYSVIFAVGWIL